jgi:hypothetical protein
MGRRDLGLPKMNNDESDEMKVMPVIMVLVWVVARAVARTGHFGLRDLA